jgi:hypothetical protein
MDRTATGLLFVGSYIAGLILVAELNAAYIIRDAVISPVAVAIIYAVIFSPSVGAAVLVLLRTHQITRSIRVALALSFAVSLAVGLEILFAAGQSQLLERVLQRTDVGIAILGGMNLSFISAFIFVGTRFGRRSPEHVSSRRAA